MGMEQRNKPEMGEKIRLQEQWLRKRVDAAF